MKTLSIQRLLAVCAVLCLILSLSLQSSARTQMDAHMLSVSTSTMVDMDTCGGCDDSDRQRVDCAGSTCFGVPATLDSTTTTLHLPRALLRAPLPCFHASLVPAPEPQPPRLPA
ncbi:hypothetical protein [Marinobacterium rhizophilum]|uniref:Uncharacterized protein n=1 Tax=Marinobacterium rhizophilum TaxID=420402 RepID=A0ABY5HFK2_9GAMM|nr:hypothetical protein [Marinobacterium rhizophilum]UTW10739.1 hypothetical protein KDW95_15770 [Marinobacterium rhizophilum]